jgi:putative DNA primase/helicase
VVDVDRRLEAVLDKLDGVRRVGSGWKARCPGHDDRTPSLSITVGEDEKILLYCHIGCSFDRVVQAAGIDPAWLFPPKDPTVVKSNGHGRRIAATYDYRDERGDLLYQVVRFDPKGFGQRRPDGKGSWDWSLGDVRRVLYNLPQLVTELAHDPNRWVFIVEGEKDVELLKSLGFLATTNAGGAGKRTDEYVEALNGRNVVVLPDNDDPGRDHAIKLLSALRDGAKEVRLVELPDLPEKGDVSDWFAAGHTVAELRALVVEARHQEPELLGPPPFPVDVLPPIFRRYVEESAASVPIPPEMVGMPLMAVIGGLVGNRISLRLRRGWNEWPGLYEVVVGDPGTNKSAGIDHASWPLRKLQEDAKQLYDLQYADYEAARVRWKAMPAHGRGEEPEPPKLRHYYTTDITLEALAGMLEHTPGICIISDELSGWVKRMNQYRQGGDREQYLSMWSSKPLKVDRKSARSVYVRTPVVAVLGGIQPDVVPNLHADAQVREGFVERLLAQRPDVPVKTWKRNVEISKDAYREIMDAFRAIDALPRSDPLGGGDGATGGIEVRLSPEAEVKWGQWYDENNSSARSQGGFLGGFFTKLEAYVARFVLILHIMANPNDPRPMISVDTMRDAIALGEYCRGQVQLFLPLLLSGAKTTTKSVGLLIRIERFIRRNARKLELSNARSAYCVTADELLRGLGNVRKDDITRELAAQTDQKSVFTETVHTGHKPIFAYCLAEEGEQPEQSGVVRGFEDSKIRDYTPVPTPVGGINGRWVGPDPWDDE